ncbi:protein hunchback [Lingula anatina]|uniref:Protein hunchback n=1 Tax=Lingula anatina TaxID=7574 RepID=A0A1S3GZK0_LINAN|nr:protein hunchback [Lingula anatina]XP_013378657.1 protein hunchback [Lingula anatina]XP_013378658.1 protein hunchback [Lingula anatina]XP_013378659.1 protein hunchback [Lingula anatina]|eukprot:XP_013378656.1 protein hunchback [Lingula anatina]
MMDIKKEEKRHTELSDLIKKPLAMVICKTEPEDKMEIVSQYLSQKDYEKDMEVSSDHDSENLCDSTEKDSFEESKCANDHSLEEKEEYKNEEPRSIITGHVTVKRDSRCESDSEGDSSHMHNNGEAEDSLVPPDLQNRYANSAVAALLLSGRYSEDGREVAALVSNASHENGSDKNQQWQCQSCSFATNNYGHYQLHSDYHRRNKTGKMFQCSKCDFIANERGKLRLHLRAHNCNQISVLQCSKCPFSSLISTKFREHLMSVHRVPVPRDIDLKKISKNLTSVLLPPKDDLTEAPVSPDSGVRSSSSPILLDALAGRLLNPKRPSSVPNEWSHATRRDNMTEETRSVSSLALSSSDAIMCDKNGGSVSQKDTFEKRKDHVLEYPKESGFASACLQSIAQGIKRGQQSQIQPYSPAILSVLTKTSAAASAQSFNQAICTSRGKEMTKATTQANFVSSTSVSNKPNSMPTLYQPWTNGSMSATPQKSYRLTSKGPLRPTVVQPEVWRRCYFQDTSTSSSLPHSKLMKTTGVQCSLLEPKSNTSSFIHESDSFSCDYCGIRFNDSVIHSIHMGCHSHTAPFMCNVCGQECGNKYAFYTHIMRGHQK